MYWRDLRRMAMVWGFWSLATSVMAGPIEGLRFIGQQIVPTGTQQLGTTVGGLSGIDYDRNSGTYYAISDDRSQFNSARFYNLSLDFDENGFYGVNFNSVQTLKRSSAEGGGTFPALTVDPESIRLDSSSGTLYWTSEGERRVTPTTVLQNPFVREMSTSGDFVRELSTPAKYNPTTGPEGIRQNLAFESLTLSTDGNKVYAATENALFQDGPAATTTTGSPARILSFDKATGAAGAEYVYNVGPVIDTPIPADAFATNGLVELLATGPNNFLSVERSFSTGIGNRIRIYNVSLAGATDVSALSALTGLETPVSKTLLLDLDGLGIVLDNIEGITLGPTLPNGKQSVVLVSDNNFSGTQFTQFLAFQAVPEPSALALVGFALASLAIFGWRRRLRT